ncbi:spondin domain-containing protein [Phycisphaeraceae bacterium D3-23]
MRSMFSPRNLTTLALAGLAGGVGFAAQATDVRVDVTNNGPAGGVFITPLWVGFHDGSFDSYSGGLSTQEGLERLAEDGTTSFISDDFLAGNTYVDGGVSGVFATAQTAGRVDGTIASPMGPPPIAPGETVSQAFNVDLAGDNQFFSYASMVLPSNDYFIANGNPLAHDLSALDGAPVGTSITFFIGLGVNDAGTEVNDFATSAANGLFPQLGLGAGQGGPNIGTDENGVVTNVDGIPFAGFLNSPSDLDTNPDAALIDFNRADLYANGIATVTITTIPEPGSLALLGLGGLALLRRRR